MASSIVPTLILTTPKTTTTTTKTNLRKQSYLAMWHDNTGLRMVHMASSQSTPPDISEKVSESIKKAEEACGGDNPENSECAAAWDEVEELSAAASHARDKLKDSDPLETYCKDNPETDECRTYDN